MSSHRPMDPVSLIAKELTIDTRSVSAVFKLLDDKATVPFIARYRKEVTRGLDEVQIRNVSELRTRLKELEDRRATILSSIDEQGKLTSELRSHIEACQTRSALEDLYLPYKKKRKTRASTARDRGLEGLARRILAQDQGPSPFELARPYVNAQKDVPNAEAALAGARDIIAEWMSEDSRIRDMCRHQLFNWGVVTSSRNKKVTERTRFEQYYDYREPVKNIPSHRYLAIARGESEDVLKVRIQADDDRIISQCLKEMGHDRRSRTARQLEDAVQDGYKRLLSPSIVNEVRAQLKLRSDQSAIDVFANNLESLLLSAPMGDEGVIGIDPGIRTGCKCAAISSTGRFESNITIYPERGERQSTDAKQALLKMCKTYRPKAIAVGNGTGGRETLAFVRSVLKSENLSEVLAVPVNEAGASVYSASDVAREEFPQLDLTVRGAISIARRLQDPLAELVKIDPKSIGVGQYQHDVDQSQLQHKLGEVVESCVNRVGVELNTASAPLLSYVAGIGPTLAKKVVGYRETNGPFRARRELLKVPGLGPRTYEQAAGFLRIRDGKHPLDASAVHPERYSLVAQMAKDLNLSLESLVGSHNAERVVIDNYISGDVGRPTLLDIVDELQKPGRDPRQAFEAPVFRDDVREISDLKSGMQLEGVVTNVTHFGAFVDLGVHQDGLVHISQLADRYVDDPHKVVRPGDRIRVRVLEVDQQRRRISLSAKSESTSGH